jgi:pyrroloquinoline quinone biosynthesis protein D
MTMAQLSSDARPGLAPGVRLTFDKARDRWVVLAPERVLVPDETALEILQRCDGAKQVDAIVDELATAYSADPSTTRSWRPGTRGTSSSRRRATTGRTTTRSPTIRRTTTSTTSSPSRPPTATTTWPASRTTAPRRSI